MKYYKEDEVLKVLKKKNFFSISGNEYFSKYSSYSDYVVMNDRLYSAEEIKCLPEDVRNMVLKNGLALDEVYLHSLMKHQHIIDNNSCLNKEQYEILRVLLKSEVHFMPFSFGNLAEGIYVIEKLKLVKLLLDGKWNWNYCNSYLDEDVYFIRIELEENHNKKDFFHEYVVKNDTFRKLEIYITYSDLVNVYKKAVNGKKSKFWESNLNIDDYI